MNNFVPKLEYDSRKNWLIKPKKKHPNKQSNKLTGPLVKLPQMPYTFQSDEVLQCIKHTLQ